MLLTLISNGKINTSSLSEEATGMQWVAESDAAGAKRYGFIEARDDVWVLSPKKGMQLLDEKGNPLDRALLNNTDEAVFQLGDGETIAALVARASTMGDRVYSIVGFTRDETITIGSRFDNTFCYASRFVSGRHASITYVRDTFSITDLNSANGTFVNGSRIPVDTAVRLSPGDVVEVLGLVMTIGHRFISHNNPAGALTVNPTPSFVFFQQPEYKPPERDAREEEEDTDYFYPAPRFMRDIERRAFSVDAPPAPEKPDETPVAMKIGPSMVMALAAVFSGAMMFMRMQESGGSLLMASPMLVMAVAMVLGSVLWPILSKRFEVKKAKASEARRRQAYAAYLDQVRSLLREETALQKGILEENRLTVLECMHRVVDYDPRLMDRTPAHSDFLELRVGMGTVPLAADIRYPDEHFSVEKDDLIQVVYQLSKEPKEIKDAPVALSLVKNPVVGVAGDPKVVRSFVFGLVAQLACLHSYEDVKLAVLVDEADRDAWAWVRSLPHAFSDDKALRFCATTLEEAAEVGLTLGRIAEERRDASGKGQAAPLPHYVVICASKRLAGKSELVGGLAKRSAPGFTVLCAADERKNLPKQCTSIVEVSAEAGTIRAKDDTSGKELSFVPDTFLERSSFEALARTLNTVHLDVAAAKDVLPESLGFLEMYEAGNVEQLNVRARWKEGRASRTLAARVGVDAQGEPFNLNLHEKFHGPHGLIAGTTGSGKSEFIITWILSMCCEYSPEEVAFVLIDYKGGGLAGAFDNDRARLPHLAGTVTNLDGAAIARSLASVKSELKRRQALFNAARPAAGGDNVDIYKYLELYRAGKVAEACPHLFIVADEFAELKQQEPEFMDELISAARIGRSLGVHLVLATQKPTGVVNDQIWSNSKFKVCLKVADAADSKEMIKRPDAAELVQAGRFYLLVGYNEQFSLGQAAWAGAPYEPADQFAPATDDAVVLVGDTGRAIAQVRPARGAVGSRPAPQLVAVLEHLAAAAQSEGLAARRLWLDPLPERIGLEDLRRRYNDEFNHIKAAPFSLEAVVGELDDPANQAKCLLTLPISQEGNAVVYGSAGSGTESVVSAVLCSLLETHSASELNTYIMDFGSETLGAFRGAPQVGDVIFSGEDEKVRRLFAFLENEVAERKKTLTAYADFGDYCRKNVEHCPAVLVVLNDMAAFYELYERDEQLLIKLTREGNRCGIYFLVTATTPTALRMRLRANFKQSLVTQFNDEGDYSVIFGSIRGIVPPSAYARGLVDSEEGIYEYQAVCMATETESEYDSVSRFVESLGNGSNEAVQIPVLPETLDTNELSKFTMDGGKIPYGLYEETLLPVTFDFAERCIERVLYVKSIQAKQFIGALLTFLESAEEVDCVMLDASSFCDTPDFKKVRSIMREDAEILDYLERTASTRFVPRSHRLVLFVSGIVNLLTRAEPDRADAIKEYLRTLNPSENVSFVLVDNASGATGYMQQEWFKEQASAKDALWVGDGLTSQSAITLGYTSKPVEPHIKADMGYVVDAGLPALVKLVSKARRKKER